MMRRYDLDWLRVLLFGLLVVHHAAVGFAPFGADIYGFANDRLGGDLLSLAIYFSHTWRLPALFLIAGIGTYFATSRGAGGGFLWARIKRLILPVLFGTAVLNFLAFYAIIRVTTPDPTIATALADWWLTPEPTQVMHLWFLVNLTVYTVLCWPLYTLRHRIEAINLPPGVILAGLALAVTAIAVLAKPHASAIAGDGYQLPWYWGIFAAGFVVGAQHARILTWVARWWWALLLAGLAGFLVEIGILGHHLTRDLAYGNALAEGGWAAAGLGPGYSVASVAFTTAEGLNAWFFLLTTMGLTARYLNRSGPALTALGRATFPVYVLHFPVTLIGLAILTRTAWPWQVDFLLLVAGTYAVTALIYLMADRAGFPMRLIGGRPRG